MPKSSFSEFSASVTVPALNKRLTSIIQVSILLPFNKILCCRWCKWPSICKIWYICFWKVAKGIREFMWKVDWQNSLEEFAIYSMSNFTQSYQLSSSTGYAYVSLYTSLPENIWESGLGKLPENKFPDGDSRTQPETSASLMQLSFSQSALVQIPWAKKMFRNCYQVNITITIS